VSESREWKHIPWSIKLQLLDLESGNYSFPPRLANPTSAFAGFKDFFEKVLEVFRSDPTPGLATVVQQAAAHLIKAGGEIYQRPSHEYRDLYASIIKTLKEVEEEATRRIA